MRGGVAFIEFDTKDINQNIWMFNPALIVAFNRWGRTEPQLLGVEQLPPPAEYGGFEMVLAGNIILGATYNTIRERDEAFAGLMQTLGLQELQRQELPPLVE